MGTTRNPARTHNPQMAWLLIALLAAAALLAGWKGGRVAMAVAAAIALGWMTTAVLVAGDRDADGYFDCGIHCTTLQDVVGFVAFAGPAALVVLLLGSLAGYLTRRTRS